MRQHAFGAHEYVTAAPFVFNPGDYGCSVNVTCLWPECDPIDCDDYYEHTNRDCLDIARSAFLE